MTTIDLFFQTENSSYLFHGELVMTVVKKLDLLKGFHKNLSTVQHKHKFLFFLGSD